MSINNTSGINQETDLGIVIEDYGRDYNNYNKVDDKDLQEEVANSESLTNEFKSFVIRFEKEFHQIVSFLNPITFFLLKLGSSLFSNHLGINEFC